MSQDQFTDMAFLGDQLRLIVSRAKTLDRLLEVTEDDNLDRRDYQALVRDYMNLRRSMRVFDELTDAIVNKRLHDVEVRWG